MFNLDEETIECTDGNKEFFLAQQESRERFLFLTSGLVVFICFWLLELSNSTRLIMFFP